MVTDYLAYEKELCRTGLIPALARHGFDPSGKSVLDVGCGYGGVLCALAEAFPLRRALGLDLDAEMIARGNAQAPPGLVLETRDFFSLEAGPAIGGGSDTGGPGAGGRLRTANPDPGGFDLIVMRDVLEHMPDAAAALRKAATLLVPGGLLFASFAPFWSPFGGHQHNGAGFFAHVPWLQALPEPWFRRLLRWEGNSYKSGLALAEDMEGVLRSRLSLRRFRSMFPGAGLTLERFSRYLIRPDFRVKFGLPTVGFPPLPGLDELACTGVEAFLRKAAS